MRLLLDTCTFLWITLDSPNLSATAIRLFADQDNEVYLSVVSAWEIAVKYSIGKLRLPSNPATFVPAARVAHKIETLALDEPSSLALSRIPAHHNDPFDRMLICQAIGYKMTILTPDPHIARYRVPTLW